MLVQSGLLTQAEGDPVAVVNGDARGAVLLVCEHASRTLPERLGTLGLSDAALVSHIAWDPGALAVARLMSKSLDATLVYQRFSRLAYDCNRPPEAPGAMPVTSEIYDIPGNRGLTEEQKNERTEGLYRPFHDRIDRIVADRRARGQKTAIVTMHSFTPVFNGVARAVEIGILHDTDSRLADAMLDAAAGTDLYKVARNEPYGPQDGVTHSLKLHGLDNGLLNVMIEVRNDLIADENGQGVAADFLTGLLQESLPALS
ncbi:N-formylglutamate amidohydrolase [Metarhizobium album]|uniref:N-formylglutamate amidohydrolase n=1 Tax=Metarhizobium album TaxID=2182425 RepID=A0A2U2DMJ9_9HYPH|nr:N-formylglutamate amidohydrolase [Rhizobium album]OJT99574.1 MAG: N-formylglutamate amidohydrolase [Rhizobium sp. 63-7]PWE54521.1 N-formylglutamate amidohydrolase [Rhizobium album]